MNEELGFAEETESIKYTPFLNDLTEK